MKKFVIATCMAAVILGGCSMAEQKTVVPLKDGQLVGHTTRAGRFLSPFGQSAGETISRAKGVKIEQKEEGFTVDFEGGTYSIWDIIWGKIKVLLGSLLMIIVIVGGGLTALYFIPGTRPFVMLVGRLVAAVIPGLGSIVERLRARKVYQEPLTQTVKGIQEYRKRQNGLTIDQHLNAAQDENAKAAVKEIKTGNNIK